MLLHKDITDVVIKTFYNELSYGFLEKVYENTLLIEIRKLGLE